MLLCDNECKLSRLNFINRSSILLSKIKSIEKKSSETKYTYIKNSKTKMSLPLKFSQSSETNKAKLLINSK